MNSDMINLTPVDIFNYAASMERRCLQLEDDLKTKRETSIDVSRFYNVAMTTEEVAKLHGVTPARVRDYASHGLIELHPNSTDAKLLFRGSVALRLDFAQIKRQKLQLKW